jgi:site-specific DNA recombinase
LNRQATRVNGEPGTWPQEPSANSFHLRLRIPALPGVLRRRMTEEGIMNLITGLGGIMQALKDADPADKAEIYRRIGLTLTYTRRKNE